MAKYALRDRAVKMRKQGLSYTQIKSEIRVSKSSLSLWLRDYPLSSKRLRELQADNQQRIENFRNTMARQRELRFLNAYTRAQGDIGDLGNKELFIGGFFLYWAEGSKTQLSTIALANTDPEMAKVFIKWLLLLGADVEKIRVYLHLYKDMDIGKTMTFWSEELNIPLHQFRQPYIKANFSTKRKNYKGRFGHGTCNIIYYDQRLYEYVLMGIKHLKGEMLSGTMQTRA